jgi:hypothetical protein
LFTVPCAAARLPPLPVAAADALADALPLDTRTLRLLLGAGASRIHVADFSALLDDPFRCSPGWRLWRADAFLEPPPPWHEAHATLPPWLAMLDDDGALIPTPAQDGWFRLLTGASGLAALAVENSSAEDAVAAPGALSTLLRGLCDAPALRSLALGFFSTLHDEDLRPLLSLRTLTRLELSHLPHISDEFMRATCRALPALTALRLDYLSITDAGLAHLGRLRSLCWFEIRVSVACAAVCIPTRERQLTRYAARCLQACPFVQFGMSFPFETLSRHACGRSRVFFGAVMPRAFARLLTYCAAPAGHGTHAGCPRCG